MADNKTGWTSPSILIALGALIVSIVANVIQHHQYGIVNKKASSEAERANTESQRANDLQSKRDEWQGQLTMELRRIDQQISEAQDNIRLAEVAMGVSTTQEGRDQASASYQENSEKLRELQPRRAALQKQISDFIAGR